METMGLLDITIKYFNVIVFVMCVIFGMISFFASWIVWREIHNKKNIVRSVMAAYNITEDAVEKGRTPSGDFSLDPAIVQTVLNNLQEVLNAVYGEITGKPMPPKEQRLHGSRRLAAMLGLGKVLSRKRHTPVLEADISSQSLMTEDREHRHSISHP